MEAVLQSLKGIGTTRLYALVGFAVALLIFFAFLTMHHFQGYTKYELYKKIKRYVEESRMNEHVADVSPYLESLFWIEY